MLRKIGSIIDGDNGGESPTISNPPADHGDQDGIRGPEAISYDFTGIDPETIRISNEGTSANGGTTADGVKRTRTGRIDGRTRAARAARGTTETPNQSTLEKLSLTELLLSVHNLGSMLLKVEELALDIDEAEKLSKAIQEVGKFYAMSFDPKKVAIANLIICMAQIYGMRIMAYRTRMINEGPKKVPVSITQSKAETAPKTNGAPPRKQAHEFTPSDMWNEPATNTEFN